MEKGLRNLQSLARTARKTSAPSEVIPAPNKEEHEGDSGIGYSEAETEAVDVPAAGDLPSMGLTSDQVLQPVGLSTNQQTALYHILPRPPPLPLPLYHPPPRVPALTIPRIDRSVSNGPSGSDAAKRERTPDNLTQRSVTIKSMLLHTPQS